MQWIGYSIATAAAIILIAGIVLFGSGGDGGPAGKQESARVSAGSESMRTSRGTEQSGGSAAPARNGEDDTPLLLSDEILRQGGTLGIRAPAGARVFVGNAPVPLAPAGDGSATGFVGFGPASATGKAAVTARFPDGPARRKTIAIVERSFPVTKLELPPKLAAQGATGGDVVRDISASDAVTLDEALAARTDTPFVRGSFVEPLDRWEDVGGFGNIRASETGAIRHLGVDLAGERGDPVRAANVGIVRLAHTLPNFGNTVVLDHGQGVFTLYLHMEELFLARGEEVARGDIIGTVGSSGAYSLEPHLHFSVKVRGESVDPRGFIDAANTVLDR